MYEIETEDDRVILALVRQDLLETVRDVTVSGSGDPLRILGRQSHLRTMLSF